ncbi:MAG: sigma-70 family RNA polymerase sigma factor [Alphaproteobacteria bacterium]|nr:sigma-70 family RNA polymerase sigma factor [Alphaproteobacteria bacterium]
MDDREFDQPEFLARLRAGEEAAYRRLVRRFHAALVGVAAGIIGSRAQAEEVVQDTWIAVHGGIARFEGRSSLASWIYAIVLNRARTRIGKEGRLVGLPSVLDGAQGEERAMPASAFRPDGHWAEAPRLWDELDPERVVGGRQLWEHVQEAIETLPAGQKAVLVMRDMEGMPGEEICALLQITPENQRVMLHRARARIRAAIDRVTAPAADRTQPAAPAATRRRGGVATRLAVALRRLAAWVACPQAQPA